jgi:hypothetical protein
LQGESPVKRRIDVRVKRRIRILIWRQADRPGEIETGIRPADRRRKKGGKMKAVLSIVLALVASFVWGQTLRQPLMKTQDIPQQGRPQTTTQTTTTPEVSGTITQYTPGSAIVLKESNGPVRYRLGNTVTYGTRSGKVLDKATVKERIRVGVPVRVHYTGTAPNMVVDRVILEED